MARSKKGKRFFGVVGVVLGVVAVTLFVLLLTAISVFSSLKNPNTGEITHGFYIVNTKSSAFYLINCGGFYTAIDSGSDIEVAQNELKKISISPDSIRYVFLTHIDYDHTAGLSLFSNAIVYMAKEESRLFDEVNRFFGVKSSKPASNLNYFQDGDRFVLGNKTVVSILTPGHTIGSTSFFVDGNLFTGDALILKNGEVTPFIKFISMDREAMYKSIEKLAGLTNIKMICTAHSGYTAEVEKAFLPWRK